MGTIQCGALPARRATASTVHQRQCWDRGARTGSWGQPLPGLPSACYPDSAPTGSVSTGRVPCSTEGVDSHAGIAQR